MNFQDAPMKREGEPVFDGAPPTTEVDVTYVERRVPRHLTHLVDALIDQYLRERGYNPQEL
jgi:hypothetical protein